MEINFLLIFAQEMTGGKRHISLYGRVIARRLYHGSYQLQNKQSRLKTNY